MPPPPRSRVLLSLIATSTLLAALADHGALAQAPVDDTVRRIRELEREIEDLLAALPPAERAEVERRLAEEAEEAEEAQEETPLEPLAAAPEAPPAAPSNVTDRDVGCRPLAVLDGNGDGLITGADRYWRHLYLWGDQDGDREVDDDEVASLFELGLRGVGVELDRYTTDDDFAGDVSVGEEVVFRLVGVKRGPDRRSLALDADGLRRGDGPSLVDAEGRALEGIRPLRRGDVLIDAGGLRHRFPCG